MNDDLARKVQAAGVAGWWTVLVATVALVIQWLAYLFVMWSRPTLVLTLWGTDSWPEVQHLWLLATMFLKIALFFMALACLWLTLWARQLRKHRSV